MVFAPQYIKFLYTPTLTVDVSAFCNLTRKRSWWYWSNDVVKVPNPYTSSDIRLIHAHPGIPEQHSFLSADMIVARTHLTVVRSALYNSTSQLLPFHFEVLSLPSQPMRTKRLIETPYQLNSVVSLGRETSVWIFLLTAPRLSNVLLQRAHVMDRLHL